MRTDMKNIFNSLFSTISNHLHRNSPRLTVADYADQKTSFEIVDMNYDDYIKYIAEQRKKKASPLMPD